MRKLALVSGAAAGLMLMAGTASAQSCSTEVDILQRQLGFEQGANARIGPTNTGVQQPSPRANVPGGYDTERTAEVDRGDDPWDLPNTGANATIGPNDPGVQQPMPAQEAERFAERDMDEPGQQQGMDAREGQGPWTQPRAGANTTIGPNDPGVQQPQPAKEHAEIFGADASVPQRLIAEVSRGGRVGDFEVNDRIAALTALRQAELYAGYDQNEACQNALNTARQHLGMY